MFFSKPEFLLIKKMEQIKFSKTNIYEIIQSSYYLDFLPANNVHRKWFEVRYSILYSFQSNKKKNRITPDLLTRLCVGHSILNPSCLYNQESQRRVFFHLVFEQPDIP